jgi:hypothetical protein
MNLVEVKKAASALGYTRIQRTPEKSTAMYLRDWNGLTSHVTGGMYAQVDYYLEGSKSDGYTVRVHKATDSNHWYILS